LPLLIHWGVSRQSPFEKEMKRLSIIAALVLVAAVASAQTSLGPRDILDVKVLEDPSLNAKVTISDDGNVTLPLLGKVYLSGLTPLEAEGRIKTALEAGYLNRANVSVQVVEYGSKPISVLGSVVRPGSINVSGNITLIQAITQAGGLSAGYGRQLYVLRTAQNGLSEQIAVDIEDLMVNGNPDLNLPLSPNDVINVPVDTPLTIYVLGEVMKPGDVKFRGSQTPTLLQVLAAAGGPTDRAGRTVIIKRNTNGKEETILINYRDILSGKKNDLVLQDNDTVYLKESVF
jgi:polysaccharide export outer membrane protein